MAWTLKIDKKAKKELAKIDKPVARRLTTFLKERVAVLHDPRAIGEPLKGKVFGEYWKYRVGDWRIIVRIEDAVVEVLVVRFAHRSEAYDSKKKKI